MMLLLQSNLIVELVYKRPVLTTDLDQSTARASRYLDSNHDFDRLGSLPRQQS